MSEALLAAHGVTARFGYRRVFDGVTLSLGGGEVLGLVGPNGAGKTTLLRVFAGLLKPTAGAVDRNGTVGLVAHHSMAYDALTAQENLAFAARLWGLRQAGRIDDVLEKLGLVRWKDQRVGTFSRGMTQRLAIARALLHDPDILLLDEPFDGLDDTGVSDVLHVLRDLVGRGRAIVLVTHQFERLAQLATSVGYLVSGSLTGPEPVDGRAAEDVAAKYRGVLAGA